MGSRATQSPLGDGSFRPRRREHPPAVGGKTAGAPLRIALINPRFEPAYYGFDHALPVLGRGLRTQMTNGALPLLAALVPPGNHVDLFDEGVDDLDFEALKSYDVIGVTGMIVQRRRMLEILDALGEHPGMIIVGGPYVSVDEAFVSGRCDVVFVGEADTTWPEFLRALGAGEATASRYEQAERTDLTTLPLPRYDLLAPGRYATAAVQFSRGCPFLCEFCDIITIFGRKPRAKTPAQVIAELDALMAQGHRLIFLVDDNFIGNKKLAREVLIEIADWQKRNNYKVRISTEASINLADEPELLALFYEANITAVFIGIESPSEASLLETRKVQNARGDSLQEKVSRIRDAGIIIHGGFMVGFDNDGPDIFDKIYDFAMETLIAQAGVSILTAIPSTPLYDRLAADGRLRLDDPVCNFTPAQMSREALAAGYLQLTERLFTPEAYFARVFGSWSASAAFREKWAAAAARAGGNDPITAFVAALAAVPVALRLAQALAREGELGRVGRSYLRLLFQRPRANPSPFSLARFVFLCAQHWHFYKFFKDARERGAGTINTYSYTSAEPVAMAAE